MSTRNIRLYFFACLGFFFIGLSGWMVYNSLQHSAHFNGKRAYKDVVSQVGFGPRIPGSIAHDQAITYIQQELEKAGWTAQAQVTEWQGFSVHNIIASRSKITPSIILGAHYDSRILADQDVGQARILPVPGANDGASGVAVLLEMARTLPSDSIPVWLVFFDAEDNGGLDSRQWIMGSQAFVAALNFKPKIAVIVDMVGDADLNLYIEKNSNPAISAEIWATAHSIGYGKYFIATSKFALLDDHTPFLEAGIPAVDIIDFDYPYWHTNSDTPDKVSTISLQAVGETLLKWLESLE
jgi:glutaminyl-peptide cyclotransferase